MNKLRFIFYIIFIALYTILPAQYSLPVIAIADSLKKNAWSVVRYDHTEYNWQSKTNAEVSHTYVVTILDEKGRDEANFHLYCDKFIGLKKFSAEIYDGNGKLIRKIKKSDLKYTEYSSHLASDGKHYFYSPALPYFPVTIKYEWETRDKNGIIGMDLFKPQNAYNQSVETASYIFNLPPDAEFKYRTLHMDNEPEKNTNSKFLQYKWKVKNLTALEYEPYGPTLNSQIPILQITPIDFIFDGYEGQLTDWQSYGKWLAQLQKARQTLPNALKEKVRELTKDVETDREKVKILYDYLADNTRYVSIQLGIGGLQPMAAKEVYNTGFGDCKALSNYMMAMLKEIGIPSVYTVIHVPNKRIIPDFASANQMNHVILQVPLPNDTLWLECTNPQLPFGYVHQSIADNDALLIKENGGQLCRLPAYVDSLNCENHHINIKVKENGHVSAQVSYQANLFQYEYMAGFTKLTPKEQTDYLRKRINVPKASVRNISYKEYKESHPYITISYEIESEQYGNKTGSRLFLPINAFRQSFPRLNNKERKNDIYIQYGYKDTDIITFELPEGFTVESIPNPVFLAKEYGTFISFVQSEGNQIKVVQTLQMHKGKYDASQYEEFVQFCKVVTGGYENKIIIKMK